MGEKEIRALLRNKTLPVDYIYTTIEAMRDSAIGFSDQGFTVYCYITEMEGFGIKEYHARLVDLTGQILYDDNVNKALHELKEKNEEEQKTEVSE